MMGSSHLDQADKGSPDTISDSSLSSDSPDSNDIFGEPLVHPRVGDEYQVEIPYMRNKSELHQLMITNPADSEGVIDSSHSFLMGLPLPVMWVSNQAILLKERMEYLTNPHAVHTNGFVKSEKKVGMSQVSSLKEEPNVNVDVLNLVYCLVPGESNASWSDFEAECFLLGLYIFGKNLLQVMRFMETKGLGEILAYYYGRFYGSRGYRRWSECRKMKNKKCVIGHRFFSGYRQQELFARLAPRLSEESKPCLLEASRAFAEGRTTLDEYASSLKALVGIRALVEAVGIGKGKEDLTTFISDGSKNSQFSHRPEIPSGKACSSLTCPEIVKYLTGDFRLSKARSNDLFWEAVWPRLLERGWHSEQPRGDSYAGSKSCLVFLMPGIRKFSRRKLSKGDHYFDSISDVLAKVSSEPELIELESDETKPSSSKVENGWVIEVKSDDDQDSSDHERHCYLKPRVSSEISNLFKFTVVDTSLANADNPSKVRQLRSLPPEAKKGSFRKTETGLEINTKTLRNGHQSPTLSAYSKGLTNVADGSERISGRSKLEPLERPVDTNLPTDHKSRTIKHQFSRRVKPAPSACSVPKKRKLASCLEPELTCILSLPAKKKKAAASRVMMTNNAVLSESSQPDNEKIVSTESLVADTPSEKILQGNCSTGAGSDVIPEIEKMPKKQTVFDLNLPQVPSDPESDGNLMREGENNPSSSSAAVKPAKTDGDDLDQQQPRRQSTRNRPLTTKALEALEFGFMNPVRNYRKRTPATELDQQKPKRARLSRSKSSVLPPVMDFGVSVAAGENGNGKTDTPTKAIPTEKAATTCEMLGLPEISFPPAASSKKMVT